MGQASREPVAGASSYQLARLSMQWHQSERASERTTVGGRERFHFTSCPPKTGAAFGLLPPLCRNLQQISHDLDVRLKSFGRGRIERQIRDGAGVSEALRFNLRQQRDEGMLSSDSFPFASNHDLMFRISRSPFLSSFIFPKKIVFLD